MSFILNFETRIELNVPISKVWDALVNPELTVKYMYGCIPVTDWKIGSPLVWRGYNDGIDYVVGNVLVYIPESELSYTVFDPNGKYENKPDNYLTTTFQLSTHHQNQTILNVKQGNYSKVDDGKLRYEHAEKAWQMTLEKLKNILESK